MKNINLNLIPAQISKGLITNKEAVHIISKFLIKNFPVFGLQQYDEDFRSDIILDILEKGESLIEGYSSDRGDFFTYLFYQIKSFVHAKTRSTVKKNLETVATMPEKITMAEEKEFNYKSIDYQILEKADYVKIPKVPYAIKNPLTPEDLRKTFENVHGDKKLLVVAIKSAYYITDSQIEKVCHYYNINENDFIKTIQYCRDSLMEKAEKKHLLQERRNSAYFHHKNLETQLYSIENQFSDKDQLVTEGYKERDARYCKNWKSLNRQLEEGILTLRPTNKIIASILGICERQVAYYINCAKIEIARSKYKKKEASGE